MPTRDQVLSDPRSGARPLGGSDPGPERRSAPAAPRPAKTTSSRPASSNGRSSSGSSGRASGGRSAPSGGSSGRVSRGISGANRAVRSSRQFAAPEFREYQGIILAEFVLAELLVAATPVASRQNVTGLSPYIGKDMVKMLSLGMVYFLLELMAIGGGGMARFGAWFGGLILLTVGLNEAANIAKDLDIFGAQPKDKSQSAEGSSDTAGEGSAGPIPAGA